MNPAGSLDRLAAAKYLHQRHRGAVDAPGDDIDPGSFQLDLFWLQSRALEAMDRRSERSAKRCFVSIHRVLAEGDVEVRDAVFHHFLYPHLVHHVELEWARQLMPPELARACTVLAKALKEKRERFEADDPR